MVVIFGMASILSVITGTLPVITSSGRIAAGRVDLNMISFGKS
jgi:hypothetical protein